jgi:hypothetical protein
MKARGIRSRTALWLSALTLVSAAAYGTQAAAIPAVARAAVQTTLYASPAGTGSSCSQSSPCALAEARSVVEGMNGSMTGDIFGFSPVAVVSVSLRRCRALPFRQRA